MRGFCRRILLDILREQILSFNRSPYISKAINIFALGAIPVVKKQTIFCDLVSLYCKYYSYALMCEKLYDFDIEEPTIEMRKNLIR